MRARTREKHLTRTVSERIDDVIGVVSPRRAYMRKAFRFAYDAIDGSRTRKKRKKLGGTADSHLTEHNLYGLREIHREMLRNNPLATGLLMTERDGVIGTGVSIQAKTGDDALDKEQESAWKEEMIDKPCDVTGRFNFPKYLGMQYLGYRRDGDIATIFLDDKLQGIEGDQMGTPFGKELKAKYFDIVNGIAFSKQNGKVVGYYIGKPDKWGYIKSDTFKKYTAEKVHHMFSPERFSQSRGEPALTPSINFIDKLSEYVDAELVAAKVNACFSVFISQKDGSIPKPYTYGISKTGKDAENNRLEKVNPGTIMYGLPGESATGIGQVRPGQLFDPFVLRMLTLIGRPLCMPLMLITLDFSGATFMNARIAYQKVQDAWMREQEWVVKPFVSRVWRWFMGRKFPDKKSEHEVECNRWPYVDPYKEAMADKVQLENKTTNRSIICARQGRNFQDVTEQRNKEEKEIKNNNLADPDNQKGQK